MDNSSTNSSINMNVLSLVLLLIVASPICSTQAEESQTMMEHNHAHMHAAHQGNEAMHDEHAAHRAMMENADYSVTTQDYVIPDVALIDESGANVSLRNLLDTNQPVALNFIFTTCTTICPVMSATFAQMRKQLGEDGAGIRLVSISIDPEYDRPEVLKAYAGLYGAGSGWSFLTGDSVDIAQVLHSFNALSGSKMNHRPLTLLKSPKSQQWVRIDGLASGNDLAREINTRILN